jgi:hypothetical protein
MVERGSLAWEALCGRVRFSLGAFNKMSDSKPRWGAASLSKHIDLPLYATYRMIEKKILPVGKIGNKIIWIPAKVDAALDRIASGEPAT